MIIACSHTDQQQKSRTLHPAAADPIEVEIMPRRHTEALSSQREQVIQGNMYNKMHPTFPLCLLIAFWMERHDLRKESAVGAYLEGRY